MDCINELRDSLNVHLGWNKARITCFVNMLFAPLTVRTVNLNKLACVVIGEAQLLSRYRRIQRFFAGFTLNYTQIAGFIFKLFFISGGQWYLSMDRKYDVHQLVYYEVHLDVYEAITREKRIKKWNRQWKINLIEENNPQWLNLANGLF